MRKIHRLFPILVLAFVLNCASSVRISEIKDTPRRFHDKKVTISGIVDETLTLPILGVGVYRLDDGTGNIWVKPKNEVPFKNDRVTVSGIIKVGISISGRSFGLILIEDENEGNL